MSRYIVGLRVACFGVRIAGCELRGAPLKERALRFRSTLFEERSFGTLRFFCIKRSAHQVKRSSSAALFRRPKLFGWLLA
jgi:hypothetical protein